MQYLTKISDLQEEINILDELMKKKINELKYIKKTISQKETIMIERMYKILKKEFKELEINTDRDCSILHLSNKYVAISCKFNLLKDKLEFSCKKVKDEIKSDLEARIIIGKFKEVYSIIKIQNLEEHIYE